MLFMSLISSIKEAFFLIRNVNINLYLKLKKKGGGEINDKILIFFFIQ